MISITAYVSGATIANSMVGDMEEAAQFFTEFADRLGARDIEELEDYLKDEVTSLEDKTNLKILGELLVRIGEGK